MKDKKVTYDQLVEARNKCAFIISKYGECYLPIFERLENELKAFEKNKALLKKALHIGTQNGTQNGTHF